MTTGAVHLKLAGDMSTDSFILDLRCFKARRGHIFQVITEVTLLVPKENSKMLKDDQKKNNIINELNENRI